MSTYLPAPKIHSALEKFLFAARHSGWSFDIDNLTIAEVCGINTTSVRSIIDQGIKAGWILPRTPIGTLQLIADNIPAEKEEPANTGGIAPVVAQDVYDFFAERSFRTTYTVVEIARDISRTTSIVRRVIYNAIEDGYVTVPKKGVYTFICDPEALFSSAPRED